MAVIKANLSANFVVVPNSAAQDKSLSWEARGVLVFMLSMPNDWAMHRSWLQEQCESCGRDKLVRILKELEDGGYLLRTAKQTDGGRMDGWDWIVYPESNKSEGLLYSRTTENPLGGEPAPTKETLIQKKHNTNISESETHQQQPADKTKNNYDKIVDAYHKILPSMPAVREITASRKTKIKNFMSKYRFNLTDWEGYLKYIADNCTWMFERRPRGRDGETFWKAKNLDFLLTEKCYLGVREGRYDDNN